MCEIQLQNTLECRNIIFDTVPHRLGSHGRAYTHVSPPQNALQTSIENGRSRCCVFMGCPPKDKKTKTKKRKKILVFILPYIQNFENTVTIFLIILESHEKLIVTLRYLSTGCSITELHYNYKIVISTLNGIICQVCQILQMKLKNIVMNEPNKQKWLDISTEFEKHTYSPNCIGVLDGKHKRITQPPDSGSIYYNYKHFFSLFDIGGYGKDSDSGLYKESTLYNKLTEKQLDIPDPKLLTDN
ncbi:hypothetical protein AGLY_003725 [Aphis glycines]|uniref:DDE Tnp4 domain-containing protein n=1 Tax=Aphis glycines TaxID=307491 RepID=A0A6G0U1I0_APHGL|nr:hypothetical protein AGLY_003725 [Aphis glycines]